MKKYLSIAYSIILAGLLSACGVKYVQPVTELPDSFLGNVRVESINVSLADSFVSRLDEEIKNARERRDKAERTINSKNKIKKSLVRKAKKNVKRYGNRVVNIEKEKTIIVDSVRGAVKEKLATLQDGTNPVDVNITISSYNVSSSGRVVLLGVNDYVYANMKIYSSVTGGVVGEYSVSEVSANGGGLGVLLVKAFMSFEKQLLNNFSEKVKLVLLKRDLP
ncbi:MAG: hypothetical protein GXP00_14040 [Alphaproteobacteria bacterium]|nr:hypothetical protein [Alphaproteobacteria bacterium]HEC01286.1 hypothetical protein [Sphingomonadales bacterium]